MKYVMLFEEFDSNLKVKLDTISYKAPAGDWDAMHSFQTRKKDGFGGRVHEKIEKELKKLYDKGINPEVKSLKIKMDESNWTVTVDAEIGPSSDGKAWMGIISRGGAGINTGPSASSKRAENQINRKLKELEKEVGDSSTEKFEKKLLLDFEHDSKSKKTHVRQIFYTYTDPKKYPKENPNKPKSSS